jgi:DNA end-binding protein Ku
VKTLRLTTLRHADEVIAAGSLEVPGVALSERELRIATELVNQLTAPFRPERFEDEHQKKLHQLIETKARGEKVVIIRPRRRKPTSPDRLVEALEASLKEVA